MQTELYNLTATDAAGNVIASADVDTCVKYQVNAIVKC